MTAAVLALLVDVISCTRARACACADGCALLAADDRASHCADSRADADALGRFALTRFRIVMSSALRRIRADVKRQQQYAGRQQQANYISHFLSLHTVVLLRLNH